MRKAKVWGYSLTGVDIQENNIYEIYTTEEILKIDTYTEYRNYDNMAGWVKADKDWGIMFTQVYEEDVEWLGDDEE